MATFSRLASTQYPHGAGAVAPVTDNAAVAGIAGASVHVFATYQPESAVQSEPRPCMAPGRLPSSPSGVARARRAAAPDFGSWVGKAVRVVLGVSTAGGADLVIHANQDAMANAMAAKPSASLVPSMSADADCTVAAIPSECQRRPQSERFTGGSLEAWQRWHSRLDRLDGLISFQGRYAAFPIIRSIQRKWGERLVAPAAQVAYLDWRRSGSYAAFMDALVAELKASGDYDRLVEQRLARARRGPHYEKDIRSALLANPDKDRAWVEARMRDFLADWGRFDQRSGESAVSGRKMVLWKLLDGERTAAQDA